MNDKTSSAGVAPQAPNAGESTAGLRSRGDIECKPAVQPSGKVQESPVIENLGSEISIPVQPSSTVDEGKLAEVIKRADVEWQVRELRLDTASKLTHGQYVAHAVAEWMRGESR